MDEDLQSFWCISSSYSYFAVERFASICRTHDITPRIKPVLPLAMRASDTFTRMHPNYKRYHALDKERVAQYLGIPYGPPNPPLLSTGESGQTVVDDIRVTDLTRLIVAAERFGQGLKFLSQIFALVWSGTVKRWDQPDHLADAVRRSDLDLLAIQNFIRSQAENIDIEIEANHQRLLSAGHWGVPTFVFRGEPFHGQDRLDILSWRMDQSAHAIELGMREF